MPSFAHPTIYADDPQTQAWCEQYLTHASERIAADVEIVMARAGKNSKILDIGAIPPLASALFKQAGLDVVGLDIAPERFSGCIESLDLDIHKCNIETQDFPFEDDTFDCIQMNEVFEHLRVNLLHTLREILRTLKPGGTFVMSTPNMRSLKGIRSFLTQGRTTHVAKAIDREWGRLDEVGHMGHVREYARPEVDELLRSIGFEVVEHLARSPGVGRIERAWVKVRPDWSPVLTFVCRKPR